VFFLLFFVQVEIQARAPPPPDPRSNLLNAIKGGQSQLKKAVIADKPAEKPKESTGAFGTEVGLV
jgi:hypothetical protein